MLPTNIESTLPQVWYLGISGVGRNDEDPNMWSYMEKLGALELKLHCCFATSTLALQ